MGNQIENQVEVQPQNKKSGKGLIPVVVVLVLLVLGLGGYIAYDKFSVTENGKTEKPTQTETQVEDNTIEESSISTVNNNSTTTIKTIFNNLVGNYSQQKTTTDKDLSCTYYAELNLKEDGTYTYQAGCDCGGGIDASGNYALGVDKIYLYNDKCQPVTIPKDNCEYECLYPNCRTLLDIEYKNGILITSKTCGGVKLELEKQ